MHTVGPGIWRGNWKSWKMRNIHFTTWKMTKSLKNVKNEKCTLEDLDYGENTENHGKLEIHTLGHEIWQGKLKKVENIEMSTVGHGIWQENWKSWKTRNNTLGDEILRRKMKKVENLKMSTLGHGIWQENWSHRNWDTSTWWLEKMAKSLKNLKNGKCTL